MEWATVLENELAQEVGESDLKQYREQFRKLIESIKRNGKKYFEEINSQKSQPEIKKIMEMTSKPNTGIKNPFGPTGAPKPPVITAPKINPEKILEENKIVDTQQKISDPFGGHKDITDNKIIDSNTGSIQNDIKPNPIVKLPFKQDNMTNKPFNDTINEDKEKQRIPKTDTKSIVKPINEDIKEPTKQFMKSNTVMKPSTQISKE